MTNAFQTDHLLRADRVIRWSTSWISHPAVWLTSAIIVCVAFACSGSHAQGTDTGEVSFNRDVRPILSDHCFACHGFDENTREADLRLDTAEGSFSDLGGYQAIQSGDLDASEAWTRITADNDSVMPPAEFHKPLSEPQKQILRAWIEQGANYEAHWSFVKPVQPEVPQHPGHNPLDAFLQQQFDAKSIEPNPEASKTTLLRRVTLDVTGLPPTPQEVDAFLANDSEAAYEEIVDRLLNRKSYGEHMAKYWLDLARYADTHGLHLDNERSMWPYRDWVVRAFNQNLPFDDFTRWQLAGDLLLEPTQEQLIASGFNRCNVTTSEGGSINEEWIYRYAVDRTSTTVEVWMGLTAGCAVCHDHKFDPLSTKEYYSLYAFFHSAADPAMDGNIKDTPPILKLVSEEDTARVNELREQVAELETQRDKQLVALDYVDPATIDPAPEPVHEEAIWFDDAFPEGAKVESSGGHPTKFVTSAEGPVFRGERSIQRTSDNQISQDFFPRGADFRIAKGTKFFVHCFLDPENPPESIMVQFHTSSWKNRVVWGDPSKINFGKEGTTEKVHMGELPASGEWVRLEFTADKVGLKPGSKVTGYAFTQFDGTMNWDALGTTATIDKANDPAWSWTAYVGQDFSRLRASFPAELKRELQGLRPETWNEEQTEKVRLHWLQTQSTDAQPIVKEFATQIADLMKEIQSIEDAAPITFIMADRETPRDSYVMLRGAYDNPGDKVTRAVPAFLPPLAEPDDDKLPNRLDLANWLLSPDHPLTSRVVVNRFWQQFFGIGLVETSADFGSQGQPPSHPELLDWLAIHFMNSEWDTKELVKLIVMSDAYRRDSTVREEHLATDPKNRLLARGPRLRLSAEVLRDQALFVSGLLVSKIGGPGVRPYQPENIWEPVGFGNSNTRYYKQDSGDSLYRRSLYTFLKRTAPPPFMSTFDAPNRELSCSVRGRSNTPLQALQLMNDIQHVEAARAFGQRILKEGGSSHEERICWAWKSVTAREPSEAEIVIAKKLLLEELAHYESSVDAAEKLIQYGENAPAEDIAPASLAAYTLLSNLLFNLDEFICKN
ncbi:MAG: DUF1553 domain-containing protein [Pirellulaceae bacterium]